MRSRREGFALLTALWLVAALAVLVATGVATARTGRLITRNRVLLARAGWAREACASILFERFARDQTVRTVPDVDLGRGTWCRAILDDPAAKLNVNSATREALASVLPTDSLVTAILALRTQAPILDLRQLTDVSGFDSSLVAALDNVLTARGTGVVNVAAADANVLRTLPGMSEEAVRTIVYRRSRGQPVRSLDELAALLPRGARDFMLARYAELAQLTAFEPQQLIARIEGGVRATPIVARAVITLVPVQGRLAVIRREIE